MENRKSFRRREAAEEREFSKQIETRAAMYLAMANASIPIVNPMQNASAGIIDEDQQEVFSPLHSGNEQEIPADFDDAEELPGSQHRDDAIADAIAAAPGNSANIGVAGNTRQRKRAMLEADRAASDSESEAESVGRTVSNYYHRHDMNDVHDDDDGNEEEEDDDETEGEDEERECPADSGVGTSSLPTPKKLAFIKRKLAQLHGFDVHTVGQDMWEQRCRFLPPLDDNTEVWIGAPLSKGDFARDFIRKCQAHGISRKAQEDLMVNWLCTHFPPGLMDLPVRVTQRGRTVSTCNDYVAPIARDVWFPICQNSCCVFVGQLSQLENCPECNAERFRPCWRAPCKTAGRCGCRLSDRMECKSINYRPLIPLLLRLMEKPSFRCALKFAMPHRDGVVADILQGSVAQEALDAMHRRFNTKCPRDGSVQEISLVLSEFYDGANVYKRRQVSFWPLLVSILSLPPSYRNRVGVGTFLLSLFTAQGGSVAEAFLFEKCLVPELNALDRGISFTVEGQRFFIQARLIMHIADGRALEKICKVQGAGSKAACSLCHGIRGMHIKEISRTVYVGHRSFLPKEHYSRQYGQTQLCCRGHESDIHDIDGFGPAQKDPTPLDERRTQPACSSPLLVLRAS